MENKPIMLAQANALTQARYDFNPIEKRCLYQIIREVRIYSTICGLNLLRICSQNVATKAT